MKLFSKLFKTFVIMFVGFIATFLGGCAGMTQGTKLATPTYRVVANDDGFVVHIKEVENAESFDIYVYQGDTLVNKFFTTSVEIPSGYVVYAKAGTYEVAVQAKTSKAGFTSSDISSKISVTVVDGGGNVPGPVDPTPKEFKITYVLNGGTLAKDSPLSYNAGETVFLKDPTKQTYKFMGWYLDESLANEKITVISNTTTGDVTLYAKWEKIDTELTGYYHDASGLTGSMLKSSLRTIINTGKRNTTYTDLKTKLPYTDESLTHPGKMYLVYSREEVNGKWDSAATWNREHMWPQSKGWFSTSGAGADIQHLRPEDPTVNSTRGNKPYGEVNGGTEMRFRGKVIAHYASSFEPLDEVKGDVARIIMYLLVCYREADNCSITNIADSYDMLLRWHLLDPVDEFELRRNERSYSVQNNRNPFIDHPEFASMIWG